VGFHKVLRHPPTHALSPVIPPNARHLCLTAAAGTELAVPSSGVDQNFLTPDSSLHPEGLRPTRGVAPSHFRALRKSRYLTNKLIRNRLLPDRRTFEIPTMRSGYIIWYYLPFRVAIPESGAH